jgi:hypothetical protein
MSTLAYAALTNVRDDAPASSSNPTAEKPGVKSYVDAMAALVPAEVLALHAVIVSLTTDIVEVPTSGSNDQVGSGSNDQGGEEQAADATADTATADTFGTIITDPDTLGYSFWGLLVLCIVVYLFGRGRHRDKWDLLRIGIPPLAFFFWTMLQKSTAFDAVGPELDAIPRTVIALFGAVVLGLIAAWLAKMASEHVPKTQ